MPKQPKAVIVTGVIGEDVHVTGIRILEHALRSDNYEVHSLGIHNTQDDFIAEAKRVNADAILVSSLAGHAEMLTGDFRRKCDEAGLKDIYLAIGGQLVIHSEEWEATDGRFRELGFDKVAPPFQLPADVIAELEEALGIENTEEMGLTG